jgi:LysM repeat protein
MNKKYYLFVIAAILLGLIFSGCTRSASSTSAGMITATMELPFEFQTPGALSTEMFAQTAAAAQGTPNVPKGPEGEDLTPNAGGGGPTALPLPGDTAAPPVLVTQAPPAQPAVEWNPTQGIPSSYTVNKGESAYCLARRFNVNPSALLSDNGLGPNSLLSPGTTLNIPSSGGSWPGERSLKSHPAQYTVSSGDTVYSIACGFGDADPNGIIAVNSLSAPYDLTPGQVLQIP